MLIFFCFNLRAMLSQFVATIFLQRRRG